MKRWVMCVLAFAACLCLTTSYDASTVAVAGGGGGECVGDLDGDGVTGIFDFLAVLAAFGDDCSKEPCDEDIDGDGMVGIGDFLAVLMDFGCGAAECETSEDCDDGNDCTLDICFGGSCINIPICE